MSLCGRIQGTKDIQQGGFLAAYRLEDGSEVWRTAREDVPTWGTPTVVESGGGATVVINGWKRMGGYNAQTGKAVWWMDGGGDIPVAADAEPQIDYLPNADMSPYLDRFSEAVARAKHWRS